VIDCKGYVSCHGVKVRLVMPICQSKVCEVLHWLDMLMEGLCEIELMRPPLSGKSGRDSRSVTHATCFMQAGVTKCISSGSIVEVC
jgi:hypothetical protein